MGALETSSCSDITKHAEKTKDNIIAKADSNGVNKDKVKENLELTQTALQFGYNDIYSGATKAAEDVYQKNQNSMNVIQGQVDKKEDERSKFFGLQKQKEEV